MSIFSDFELKTALRPSQAARLLGIEYPRYNELKNGTRKIKPYHRASVDAHLKLIQKLDAKTLSQFLGGRKIIPQLSVPRETDGRPQPPPNTQVKESGLPPGRVP